MIVLERFLGRSVRLIAREDHSACFQTVRKGYSKRLAHVVKTHKVSISALNECYWGNNEKLGDIMPHETNAMIQQETEYQRADLLQRR